MKLYDMEDCWDFSAVLKSQGVLIRKAIGTEFRTLPQWVAERFSDTWAAETQKALSNSPISCFVAVCENRFAGFACYDSAALGYFGPVGVAEEFRGKGVGGALLRACLLDMKFKGYGYAIIGWTGGENADFYKKTVGAVEIPDSSPGIWKTAVL